MTPLLRGSTAPLPGRPDGSSSGGHLTLQATSPVSTEVGDLVLVISWHGLQNAPGTGFTLRAGYNGLANFFIDDGNFDGCLGIAWKIATEAGAQIYQAWDTNSPATDCRTALRVYQKDTFDTSAFPIGGPTGFTDGAVAPDPASVTLNSSRDYLVEAIAGWAHGAGTVNLIPGAPPSYGNLIETAGAGWIDLVVANRAVSGAASTDPGAFTDNVDATSNRNSVACTVAILGAVSVRRGRIGQVYLEAPDGSFRRGRIGQVYLEAPAGDQRRGVIGQVYLQAPDAEFPGQISYLFHKSWARYRYQSGNPLPNTARRGRIGQVYLEAPIRERRGRIGWIQLEAPNPTGTNLAVAVGMYNGAPSNLPPLETAYQRAIDISDCYANSHRSYSGDWTWLTDGTHPITAWGTWVKADSRRRLDIALGMCPWAGSNYGSDSRVLLAQVANGDHNSKFVSWGNAMLAKGVIENFGREVYVRLGWEMDATSFPHSCHPSKDNAATFAEAWRTVVTRLRTAFPNVNWKWHFCPTYHMYRGSVYGSTVADRLAYFNSVYPGDDYVDIIGSDFYDSWTTPGYDSTPSDAERLVVWNNYELQSLQFMNDRAVQHGKRQGLGEWACVNVGSGRPAGGDNSGFIQKTYDWVVGHNSQTTGFEYVIYYEFNIWALSNLKPNAQQVYRDTFADLPRPDW